MRPILAQCVLCHYDIRRLATVFLRRVAGGVISPRPRVCTQRTSLARRPSRRLSAKDIETDFLFFFRIHTHTHTRTLFSFAHTIKVEQIILIAILFTYRQNSVTEFYVRPIKLL